MRKFCLERAQQIAFQHKIDESGKLREEADARRLEKRRLEEAEDRRQQEERRLRLEKRMQQADERQRQEDKTRQEEQRRQEEMDQKRREEAKKEQEKKEQEKNEKEKKEQEETQKKHEESQKEIDSNIDVKGVAIGDQKSVVKDVADIILDNVMSVGDFLITTYRSDGVRVGSGSEKKTFHCVRTQIHHQWR